MKKYFDKTIYPNSKIESIPNILRPIAVLIRHILKRHPKYLFQFDGVATIHNLNCLNEPRFKYALSESISAGGFDYRIYMRQHQAIWAADCALRRNPRGTFVELGTAKGYFMTTILASFKYLGTDLNQTQVLLFDSFVPSATDNKNSQGNEYGKNIYYAENVDQVKKTFSSYSNVEIHQGLLPNALNQTEIQPISFIHIDLNSPEIEIECLKQLWEKILPGGMILIDDYAYSGYGYTNDLFNDFAKEFNASILTTAWGPGLIIK